MDDQYGCQYDQLFQVLVMRRDVGLGFLPSFYLSLTDVDIN